MRASASSCLADPISKGHKGSIWELTAEGWQRIYPATVPPPRSNQAMAVAGNISATPAKALLNFIPSSDSLLAGETRVFRL